MLRGFHKQFIIHVSISPTALCNLPLWLAPEQVGVVRRHILLHDNTLCTISSLNILYNLHVYVIARAQVKFGIYPKISLLPVLSQINTTASLMSKYLIFKLASTMSSGFFALVTPTRHAVKVENTSS